MAEILIKHWCLYNNIVYYIKVSGIASGNKLIKTIRYPHISSHVKISMTSVISSLSLKLYLNSSVYHRNIFGSSSKVFGNLRTSSEIIGKCSRTFVWLRDNFGKSSEIFGKWSEIFGKSSKTAASVY